MKALQGVEGHVEWLEQPSPTCDVGQVRIRVATAGLNRADLLQRSGLYPPPAGASHLLGLAGHDVPDQGRRGGDQSDCREVGVGD